MSLLQSPPLNEPGPSSEPGKPAELTRHKRRWGRIVAGVLAVPVVACSGWLLWENAAERELRHAVEHLTSVLGEKGVPVTARVQVVKGIGLPKVAADLQADVAIAAPEHLWVSSTVDKGALQLGRNGQQIWTWQPGKSFAIVAEPGVARFASAPTSSIDQSHLGPLALPVNRLLVNLLPRFCAAKAVGEEEINGEKCRVISAVPATQLGWFVKLPAVEAKVWVRETDGWPLQIGYRDQRGVDALVEFVNLKVGPVIPESRWALPAPPEAKVEHVALSHFQNFFGAAAKLAGTPLPTLPAADGSRTLVASHGKGRLEMREGTRVLFLRGAPEEMGEQHGTLMRAQVRDLVERVLYGVGVGSSFSKGRWFFGEIERCQARLAPFIDARYLREMDAIAAAAGLQKEEIRLANFFPELFHCSGFAVMGEATEGHRIYHGRILDYMKGIGLEANAVVTVSQPDDGRHSWVNVGYAGFTGSVTAMNDQHISIGEMGGRGEGNWDGKPMAQLVREVMEKAGSLDEAVEIMRQSPRTCEYFYVIADGRNGTAVGIAATPETFDVVHSGEAHPRLPTPVKDAVLLSAGDRYTELVRRVQAGFGTFTADSARELMTRPVCMNSNIHSVLFAPDSLDFWVANADSKNVASQTRYTHYNLGELISSTAP